MDNTPSSSYVQVDGARIAVKVSTTAEAKAAIRELKLKKREFGLDKRMLLARQKEIRAAYTAEVRGRGSMVRGGGWLLRIVRMVQTGGRDKRRAKLAADLAPIDEALRHVDEMLLGFDKVILQLEAEFLQGSTSSL